MIKSNLLIVTLAFNLSLITLGYSQTKKEKKVETKSITTEMYGSTENKEAKEYYDKAYGYGETKDYKNAVKWYEKAVKADPKFIEAYDNMGAAYRKMGDLENAKKSYFKSIELYPQGNMAHQNLGIVYWIEKKHDKALEQYTIMQKNDSTDAEGFYGPIQIYFALKDFKNAIKSAHKTLEIYEATNSPYIADAQYMLGISYYYDKDDKNAKIYLEQAKKSGIAIPENVLKDVGIK
jgi:tetratricopeptide (TPR) repeat protein